MNRPDLIGAWDDFIGCMQHIRDSGNDWPVLSFELKDSLGRPVPLRMKLSSDGNAVWFDRTGAGVAPQELASLKKGRSAFWRDGIKALEPGTKAAVWELLLGLAKDPLGELSRRGKDLGWCACCGRPLSNQESVDRGIGPDCWKRLHGERP